MGIEELREEINAIDDEIIDLLVRRMNAARKIGIIKKEKGTPIENKTREKEIFLKLERKSKENKLDEHLISELYEIVLKYSKKEQIK